MNDLTRFTIGEYSDFYSEWYGLADGTMLPLSDPSGDYFAKIDGKVYRKFLMGIDPKGCTI